MMRRLLLVAGLLILLAAPASALEGWTSAVEVGYAPGSLPEFHQDIVVHREVGRSFAGVQADGSEVWHVYVGDRCRSDYGDVRFTVDGTELYYYRWPGWTSKTAEMTVRIPQYGPLLIWYNNTDASTTSDPHETFVVFEDFEDPGAAGFVGVGTTSLQTGEPGFSGNGLQAAAYRGGSWGTTYWEAQRTITLPDKPVRLSIMTSGVYNGDGYDSYHGVALDDLPLVPYSRGGGWRELAADNISSPGEQALRLQSYRYWHNGGTTASWDNLIVRFDDPAPPIAISFQGSPPHLVASPISGPAPLLASLTDVSAPGETPRFWQFGDGTTSDDPGATQYHVFDEPGTYEVVLSVRNPSGAIDRATTTIRAVEGDPGSWGVYHNIISAPAARDVAAYGAVALPDGGIAWIEMTEPESEIEDLTWSAEPQYWRVARADADGVAVWFSDEYVWQRSSMVFDGGAHSLSAEEWYDPKIMVLDNGNALVYDSVPTSLIMRLGPAAISPPRSWLREIDADTGETVWTSEIEGWAITGIVERPGGGYWAVAANQEGWYQYVSTWYCSPPEASYGLELDAVGSVTSSWRLHTELYRFHSMSHPFSLAPVSGSDGEYWVFGWKSRSHQIITGHPVYSTQLRPQADRINFSTQSVSQYFIDEGENPLDSAVGSIPSQFPGAHASHGFTTYSWGRPNNIMRLAPTSDGGALVTYDLHYYPTTRLTRLSSTGEKLWSQTYVSPASDEEIPVIDVVEVAPGVILALLQDGPMIRVSRLDSVGSVQQTVLIGDPGGITTAKRIIAAPTLEHPYACIVTGSTTGFGASGTDALLVRMDTLEDLINLGSGGLTLDTDVAYAAEEVYVSATLDLPAWGNATYWISVVGEDGTLYETLDLTENDEMPFKLGIHTPPGNYTLTLNAYCEEYNVLQALAVAHLTRLDVGEVFWDRDVTYLGESPAIGFSYIPDYERYSYWIEVRDPSDFQVELHRLPIPGGMAVYVNPENMTTFGEYIAEIFPIRKADETRIPGNTSTVILSDDTWLYGTIADLQYFAIPGATISVKQPTHPDPEVAGQILVGVSDANGTYEVSGLIPRYPAEVRICAEGFYEHVDTININISGRIYYPAFLTAIPPHPLPEIVGTAVYPPRNNPAYDLEIILENSTSTLVEVSDSQGRFRFPPLTPDVEHRVYARNATGHRVSEIHVFALARGQVIDLLLEVVDESLLPYDVDFVAKPISGPAPLRVEFVGSGENVTSWHWQFGDGGSGAGQSARHTYGLGLWSPTLVAENYFGIREVTKTGHISVSGSGGAPAQIPVRFVIQSYSGQPLEDVTVTATPLESTGPWAWLLDLLGVSGDVDINGTVLSGSTDTSGAVVLPMIRTVKYHIGVTDPGRGIDTEITIYPQEAGVLITVWPQEPQGPANDFELYAEEDGAGSTRVGVRYATSDLTRITFTVRTEEGDVVAQKTSSAPSGDLFHVVSGNPGDVYLYGYVAEHQTAGCLRQDRYIRFAGESRPLVDLADWIPLYAYKWAAIGILIGFATTFVRGEIRGAMLTLPILAGILQVIGWLQAPWLLIGTVLVLGVLIYIRMSEQDLRI